MNIAVNTRLLLKNKLEGIGWYTFETLKRITKNHPEHTFYFIFDRPFHEDFIFSDNIKPIVISPPTRHPLLWYIWFEYRIPAVLKKIKADVFLSPDGYLSTRTKTPSISVIHDINFAHRPMDIPFWARKYYNYYFPKFARIAKKVVTVSEYSKNDISKTYSVSPEKINVTHNGVNELFSPVGDELKSKIKDKYSFGEDYFVFVGAMHPRKNVIGLFNSFELFKTKYPSKTKLVIVGEMMFKTEIIKQIFAKLKYKDDIIFVGRQNPDNLKDIVASASAMVFVPFFEGFGIPIVEAMRCGTPVICSNTTSMPEVAGNAAILVNPESNEEIAEAMNKITSNPDVKKELSEKGIEQSKKYSWDYTADKLWKTIENVLLTVSNP